MSVPALVRDEAESENYHIEDLGLIARQCHGKQLSEQLVIGCGNRDVLADGSSSWLARDLAGLGRRRFLQLEGQLLLELTDGGEVFVKASPVGGAYLSHHPGTVLSDAGEDATT